MLLNRVSFFLQRIEISQRIQIKSFIRWVVSICWKFWVFCNFSMSLIFTQSLQSQTIVINEVMASNAITIKDEDGDSPDWIELYNISQNAIDLNGFGLSDDAADPFKWTFPSVTLQPDKFLIFFASGKNRSEWLHWETIIDWGDQWRYRLGTSEPPADWRTVGFDDSNWYLGASGFGYGDNDDATIVPLVISVFVRKAFTIADKNAISKALLHVDYDDAFVAYLNNVEIARANIETVRDHPAFNQTAWTYREAQMYQGGKPEQFVLNDVPSLFQNGKNVLAIQVHNHGINSSDLSLIPFLSIGFSTPLSDSSQGMSQHLDPIINFLHTNFKISADGERITFNHSNGQSLDQIDAGKLATDISYGRQPDGGASWFYFNQPTPGVANTTHGFQFVAGEPLFSHQSGFYEQSFLLTMTPSSPQSSIYYSLDGSTPSTSSHLYQTPIPILRTTVIRARELLPNALPGKTITRSYFMNEAITLPVVSLTTDPPNLWDPDSGIYVLGRNYEPNPPHFGANFWQDWERPVHVEFFEPDGELGFNLDAGMMIFGGWSRDFAQKSLTIFARSRYGDGEIEYQIFPDKPIDQFEAIVLRNSGNDWLSTLSRDGMMQSLLKNTDLDIQAYRPAVIFLNGEYWGILNIREKINEHFLAANRDVDPANIDLLENQGWHIHGDEIHYRAMLDYVSTHDMQLQTILDSIKTMMDVDNFMDYQIAQIYFDNTDWPGNNIKFWRPRTADGRWKWIVFDTDFGFGLWDAAAYRNSTLEFATAENGPGWPNPPWSTFLLRKLLENPQFKTDFINRCADHLNVTFHPNRVNQHIDAIKAMIEPEIQRHQARWAGSIRNWRQNVQVLKQFANFRSTYVKAHFITKFQLNGMARITLDIAPPEAGHLKVNSLLLTQFPWQGDYFNGIPIHIEAIPEENYRFVGWSDSAFNYNQKISVTSSQDVILTAYFKETSMTAIEHNKNDGLEFSLGQNYPNPFNSSTFICYELPENSYVIITIFNLNGQEIARLVNQYEQAGRHRLEWNTLNEREISSGMYFYKIEADSKKGGFAEVKKMLFLK